MPAEQNKTSPSGSGGSGGSTGRTNNLPSWLVWVLVLVVGLVVISALQLSAKKTEPIPYTKFTQEIQDGNVKSVTWNNVDATITGEMKSGETFTTTGPTDPPPELLILMDEKDVAVEFDTPTAGFLMQIIPLMLPILLIIGFFVWMQRRAQGQMGGIMSIGRSRAKTYSTERPATLFADVAG